MIMGHALPFANEPMGSRKQSETESFYVEIHRSDLEGVPKGGTIIEDEVPTYLKKRANDEEDDLVVVQESLALRIVRPVVDNQRKIEAIIDRGCQIIAMSQAICHDLGLTYNPQFTLNMQSANGEVS